jgi:hypothetical protein
MPAKKTSCVLLLALLGLSACGDPPADDEAIEMVQYLPLAIVVPKGEELRSAEAYAAKHEGHRALWAETSRPIAHYGSRAAIVLKEVPFGELRRGMIIVYLTQMGVQAGGLLVAQEPAGWRVKDWGAATAKDRFITPPDVVGVVVVAFVAPPEPPQENGRKTT